MQIEDMTEKDHDFLFNHVPVICTDIKKLLRKKKMSDKDTMIIFSTLLINRLHDLTMSGVSDAGVDTLVESHFKFITNCLDIIRKERDAKRSGMD